MAPTIPDESLAATLQHLQNLAQQVLPTCSALSAYYGRQLEDSSQHDMTKAHAREDSHNRRCGSCGSMMVPGWSCRKYRSPRTTTRKKKASKQTSKSRDLSNSTTSSSNVEYIAYQCDLCQSVSRFRRVEKTTRRVVRELKTAAPASVTLATPAQVAGQSDKAILPPHPSLPASKPTTDAKKRKKNKSGGLAALLAKSKSESALPAGFDLMDFMKSG